MKHFKSLALLITILGVLLPTTSTAGGLDIYWIDVEGGAATLVVTEAGETVLMDSGWPGFDDRDAERIQEAMKESDVDKIDYLITSHFHRDHVGGLAALARRVEIRRFLDHGDSVEQESERGRDLWATYLTTVEGKRQVVEPGDKIPLEGVELTIVAAHSRFLQEPLGTNEPNPLCESSDPHPEDKGENGKSTGYLLELGDFRFVNLGDLSWNFQYQMACPVNLLGKIDLYQVTHHGVRDDVVPQQMWAMEPAVAVMNNGPKKGGGVKAMETVMASPALEDLWQMHRAVENDSAHNTDERLTANLGDSEGCQAHWLHAKVRSEGSYTITNSRNGHSRTYEVRQ